MSKNTNEIDKEEKIEDKISSEKEISVNSEETTKTKETLAKEASTNSKENAEDKKFHKVENKSVQNKVIENIKKFISKIVEMQEKVRNDEEEEKKLKQLEKEETEAEEKKLAAPSHLLEYYDLPYRYNETVVKILAQTPKRLFVYWDIADKDKQTYMNAFGEKFFEDTYPVLLVHNENKNYTSEIAINDFANSWYLDISDPRDKYTIQLGRKFKSNVRPQINSEIEETNIALSNDYLLIAMSNKLEVPNDHILFEEFKPYVVYRNVKTHKEEVKNIRNMVPKSEIKAFYQEIYDDEITLEGDGKFDMLNPSSMGTSSSIAK